MNHLAERFARAGLDLRLVGTPFTTNPDIFALDIRRTRPHDVRTEHFIAWMGKEDNTVQVQAVDRAERQIVLFVREARRSFTETVPEWATRTIHAPVGSAGWRRIVAQRVGLDPRELVVRRDNSVIVERTTSGGGRHLLVGCDERQLFMCELPKACTSVKQAHDALRPREVPKGDKTIRQGEWFFVRATPHQISEIERALRGNRAVVRLNTAINNYIPRAGKPHIASEITLVGGVFARGAVRHPDHKTIELRGWYRVVKNLEVVQNRSVLGGTWID
jgi:hypothetical protein